MDIKDEFISNQKIILDMLEALESHLKPKAMSLVANDVRYLLLGLAGALKQFSKSKNEWTLGEQAAATLVKLDKDYASLENQFKDYKQKWVAPDAIESSPEDFVQVSKDILTSIYKYLNLEKEKLFHLL